MVQSWNREVVKDENVAPNETEIVKPTGKRETISKINGTEPYQI